MSEGRTRKPRNDAGIPRMQERDIQALRWIGEQGAASFENLRDLLGRMSEWETDEPGRLSVTRVRHIVEDRWGPAQMVSTESILGKKWVWLTRRALHRVDLPFSPYRPADITLNHLHHINRIRLDLEKLYSPEGLTGSWESSRLIERCRKEWMAMKKEDPILFIPRHYKTWHMPDGIWTFRNSGDTEDHVAFIEVEITSKGVERTEKIMKDLARHGTTWYYVDRNPKKKHLFATLIEALDSLDTRFDHRSRFYFYDLNEPDTLIYPVD
jgi:hypothetical protein